MRASHRLRGIVPFAALLPMALTVIVGYLGSVLWSLRISFTSSRSFPSDNFVGLAQYVRLFDNERWMLSLHNLAVYGVLFVAACMLIGFLLAVFIDQNVTGEGVLRTVFLYPYAMSFVATGLVWQWMLTPGGGIGEALRRLGFAGFEFDWIVDQDMVIYTIVIATVWQASGLVMAMMLAGLRGIDGDIWKAARLDGIPAWRVYTSDRAADDGADHRHRVPAAVDRGGQAVRRGGGDDPGRPRHRQRSAGQVHHGQPVRPRQHRPGLGRRGHAAGAGAGRAGAVRLRAQPQGPRHEPALRSRRRASASTPSC